MINGLSSEWPPGKAAAAAAVVCHTLSRNIPARDKSHSASSGPETGRKHVWFYGAGRFLLAKGIDGHKYPADCINFRHHWCPIECENWWNWPAAGSSFLDSHSTSIHLGFAFCGVLFTWIGPYFNGRSWLACFEVLCTWMMFQKSRYAFLRIFGELLLFV